MKNIKSAMVGIGILFACLAWSAPSEAGMMMGGGHHGGSGHHGDYDNHQGYGGHDGYDGHHGNGAYHGRGHGDYHGEPNVGQEPGWDQSHGNRSMDEPFEGAGEDRGAYRGNTSGQAPADSGQHRQGP